MSKLFIICGHGAGDPGACANGFTEAERVRALGKRMKELGGDHVALGDINRDYYQDNGITNLNIEKDYQILELHLDSSGNTSACGGHVIIKSGYRPDSYDNAVANLISSKFPGRSEIIVQRSNLANINRAAFRGYAYRLLECCFITNVDDLNRFNNQLDDLAIGLLGCFGIESSNQPPVSKPQNEPVNVQKPTVNDSYDPWVAELQKELNAQGFRDSNGNLLSVDGIWGSRTLEACPLVKQGAKGNITRLIQKRLNSVDFNIGVDGIFGADTKRAISVFQRNRGLSADGIVGRNTWRWLLKGTKF